MDQLTAAVLKAYSSVSEIPEQKHPFPVGRRFAEQLGYPAEALDRMPSCSWEAFTGVSNVSCFAEIPVGSTVLDVGCGAGLDSLIAAERTEQNGRVLGLDFSPAMIRRACQAQ